MPDPADPADVLTVALATIDEAIAHLEGHEAHPGCCPGRDADRLLAEARAIRAQTLATVERLTNLRERWLGATSAGG